jgi:hypothetical protein
MISSLPRAIAMPSAEGPAHGHHAPWYRADDGTVKPEVGAPLAMSLRRTQWG